METIERWKEIDCFVFDVDGVLTDGSVLVLENGLQARQMNIKDGYALQLAVKKGYRVIIISGAVSEPVKERLNKLGITDVFMGIEDKKNHLENYLNEQSISASNVLFMGDDMPDVMVASLEVMMTCPADAITEIKNLATYVSIQKGGWGCVRDVIEKTMKARGDWNHQSEIVSR